MPLRAKPRFAELPGLESILWTCKVTATEGELTCLHSGVRLMHISMNWSWMGSPVTSFSFVFFLLICVLHKGLTGLAACSKTWVESILLPHVCRDCRTFGYHKGQTKQPVPALPAASPCFTLSRSGARGATIAYAGAHRTFPPSNPIHIPSV